MVLGAPNKCVQKLSWYFSISFWLAVYNKLFWKQIFKGGVYMFIYCFKFIAYNLLYKFVLIFRVSSDILLIWERSYFIQGILRI